MTEQVDRYGLSPGFYRHSQGAFLAGAVGGEPVPEVSDLESPLPPHVP